MASPSDAGFARNPRVPFLQREHRRRARPQRQDRIAPRGGRRQRCRVRYVIGDRRLTHGVVVALRFLAEWRVDEELDLTVEHEIHAVGTALVDLERALGWNPPRA